MKLPVDTSAIAFLCALEPQPVLAFDTKQPRADENGEPLFVVQLIALGEGEAEILAVKVGHSSSAAALRYQHVMAGRDAAIAAVLDELVQAASARSEDGVDAGSGTRVARTGQHGRKGHRR